MSYLGTITVGDTDTIELTVSPASALDGARVRADLWLGDITTPTWSHRWDSDGDAPTGVTTDAETGELELATSVVTWTGLPARTLRLSLEIELTRGGSVETLPHYTVDVRPQRIV